MRQRRRRSGKLDTGVASIDPFWTCFCLSTVSNCPQYYAKVLFLDIDLCAYQPTHCDSKFIVQCKYISENAIIIFTVQSCIT